MNIGKRYTFNTLAPAILGTTVRNAKVMAIADFRYACTFINVPLIQRNVFPSLPLGTPDSPEHYTYYVLEGESGNVTVLADAWIQESSIELYVASTINVSLPNVSLTDVQKIRDALNLMGYSGFNITVS